MSPETPQIRVLPGTPKLFTDYVCDFGRVSDLFAHDFRDGDALARAASAAAERALPREQLAEVLLAQNRIFGSGERALGMIDLLRGRGSATVVTGQQPGLFGGPLYNLYKAATTVRLAQRLEEQTGRTCVPVFWIASDDHRLAEVDHIHTLDGDGGLVRISWSCQGSRRIRPIAALTLDGAISATLGRLAETARGSRHGGAVLELVSDSFRPGERLTDAFGRLMAKLFEREGLVLVDASDPRLRRLGMGRLARELDYPSPSTEAARDAVERLTARGYAIQVPLRDDRLNLFFGRSERFRLRCGPDGFQISIRSGTVDAAELRASFEAELEQFSPNVLLRPLYQDALFPTAAYVAGPSEIAYFAQLRPVFACFDLPMPVVYPRKSITLVNSKARSLLAESGLRVEDFWGDAAAASAGGWLPSYLFPAGELQERMLGIAYGLLDSGPELVPNVLSALSLADFDHQIVQVYTEDAVSVGREAAGG
jgi:bacillithiol biosynthesis cysteine-adding enzyme BshC